MYTETDDVYRDRRCIQRQTMYTETDDVYRDRRCIQTLFQSNIRAGCECLWKLNQLLVIKSLFKI